MVFPNVKCECWLKDKLQGKFNSRITLCQTNLVTTKFLYFVLEEFPIIFIFYAFINFGFFLSLSGKTFVPYYDRTKDLILSFENLLNQQFYKHEGSTYFAIRM